MGPKRVRAASSSSSSSGGHEEDIVDHSKFPCLEAQQEYYRIIAKTFIKERGFRPEGQDGELCVMIRERGWGGLTAAPMPIPMSIVREFYANAKVTMNDTSMVRSTEVDYQPSAIRNVLRLPARPPAGAANWITGAHQETDLEQVIAELCIPGSRWTYKVGTTQPRIFPAAALNRYAKAWNLFICAKLLPSSHQYEITAERAILLWGIITGEYIDVGYLIHQNIVKYLKGTTTGNIPHALVIAMLCAQQGVHWGNEQMQYPNQDITHSTIAKFEDWAGGEPHPRGRGFIL